MELRLYNGIYNYARATYHPKGCSTTVEKPLQIPLKMQNKPNLCEDEIDTKHLFIRDYRIYPAFRRDQNKPNSKPIKPNFGPKIRGAKPNKAKTKPIL